jgi:hypothetical protein
MWDRRVQHKHQSWRAIGEKPIRDKLSHHQKQCDERPKYDL